MRDMKEFRNTLPDWVTVEHLEWVYEHMGDKAFEMDLSENTITEIEGNTIYHIIPHYPQTASEDVLSKLQRIMSKEATNFSE